MIGYRAIVTASDNTDTFRQAGVSVDMVINYKLSTLLNMITPKIYCGGQQISSNQKHKLRPNEMLLIVERKIYSENIVQNYKIILNTDVSW